MTELKKALDTIAKLPPIADLRQTIKFRRLHAKVEIPKQAYEGSAAYDLAAFDLTESGRENRITLPSHSSSRPIGTGLCIKPPVGYVTLVCSRSGLAARGIFVANSPGVVDPDYTGELKVILYNGSYQSQAVRSGERIAQLLFVPFGTFPWVEMENLPSTVRGDSGFGSSGL
jgi:dUTP pyrophosphatase